MQRLGILLATLAIMLSSSLALAQVDPEFDSIGIYFDTEASIHRITLLEGQHHAYLAITRPTDITGISGWECRISTEGPVFVLEYGILGQAINAATPPNFAVGLAEPFPFADSIIVMDMTILLTGLEEIHFYIHPSYQPSLEGVPAYASGGNPENLWPLQQSTGGEDYPVAVINGDTPVADEDATWGGVKALYR